MHFARLMNTRIGVAVFLLYAVGISAVRAEMTEVTIAEQPSLGHLPLMVMQDRKLFEAQAAQLGLKNVTVKYLTLAGGAVMNDGLLSGNIQFASGGVPPLLLLWSKTAGTPMEVRGVSAMSSMPLFLNTDNPRVHSVSDLSEADKIALPGVKVSIQAILLQMAAEKAFGVGNYTKLDDLTVTMAHPEGMSALLAHQEVTGHFSAPPVQEMELNTPGVRTILNSDDILGGPSTFTVVWTSLKFKRDNPLLYEAFVGALGEAMKIIKSDPAGAVDTYMKLGKGPGDRALVEKLLAGPSLGYATTPVNVEKYIDFMVRVGTLRKKPDSWKDVFFDSAYKNNND